MKHTTAFGTAPEPVRELAAVEEVIDGIAKVRPWRNPICTSCGSQSVCFPAGGSTPLIDAENEANANVGDLVELQLPESGKIGASLVLFGVPVALTIGGTLLGMSNAADSTGGAAAGAIAGLALGMMVIHFANRIVSASQALKPVAVEVVGHVQDPPPVQ